MSNQASSTTATPAAPAPAKSSTDLNKGGRRPAISRKYFTRIGEPDSAQRYDSKCHFCKVVIKKAKADQCTKHLTSICKAISAAVRQEFEDLLDADIDAVPTAPTASRTTLKQAAKGAKDIRSLFEAGTVSKKASDQLNSKLLRWLLSTPLWSS